MIILLAGSIQAADVNSTDANMTISDNVQTIAIENDTADTLSSDITGDSLKEADKNHTELMSPTTTIYYKGDFKITLKDSNSSENLANKTIDFIINNVKYTSKTDLNGIASVNLLLNPGKYSVKVSFSGDDIYEASNTLTSTVEILPTVKAYDVTKYYKGSVQYSATFLDSLGNPLAKRDVSVTVNGKSYTKRTDNKGVVYLPLNLKPGSYKITSKDPITGYQITTTFKILETISASNIQKFIGDGKKFTAKFLKSNGKALAKKYIKFKLKGKFYKVKTNSKGIAKLSLSKLKKGTYKVICYNKDGLSKSFKIQVYKNKASTKLEMSSYTFYQNESKSIKIKFTTSIAGPSISGKTINIKINGKTYSRKTDSSGMIYLDLPSLSKGLYTVECKYAGSKYIKASAASNYLTVLDNTNTKLTVKSTTSFGYGAGTQFKVALTAGGVPLIKKTVTFDINGKKFRQTTDNNGIASLTINLNIGKYTISYNAPGDLKVNASSGSCDIDVFKRSNTKLTWNSKTTFKDSLQTFNLRLTDSNGQAVSNRVVKLIIDGETYTATTNSNGYATIKTSVALGKYKVSVKFEGDNFYIPSSTSKSVNVKLSLFKNGINEKNGASSSSYLKSSSYCKVGTKKIKALVKSLTKGLKSKIDKAKAIFNYVRDTLGYSYYYNSKYGSSTTLKLKRGNCADHSHLLVAMYRTAGFQARYVHGKCTFSDERTGHVWTQVKIGNTWVCGDAISYRNSLGKIKNWNTKTVTIKGKYASLPF